MHTDRQEQMWVPAALTSLSTSSPKKKKVMIESLHGSHVLIGLLSYHYYTTTTLDSVLLSLSRIVSDMKREGLYELLFYTQSCLTLPKNESFESFWPMKLGYYFKAQLYGKRGKN